MSKLLTYNQIQRLFFCSAENIKSIDYKWGRRFHWSFWKVLVCGIVASGWAQFKMSKLLTFNFKAQITRYNLYDPLITSWRIGDMEHGWWPAGLQPAGSSRFLRLGKSSSWAKFHGKLDKDSKIQYGGSPKLRLTLMIFARRKVEVNWIYFSLNLNKIRYNWAFLLSVLLIN